jgi:hypothetical protein
MTCQSTLQPTVNSLMRSRQPAVPFVVPLERAQTINSSNGSINQQGASEWWVEAYNEEGDGGIRFIYPLNKLVAGTWRFEADILSIDGYDGSGQIFGDFRDIEPPFGPFVVGHLSTELVVPGWDSVLRFVDVWPTVNVGGMNVAEFVIANPKLTCIALAVGVTLPPEIFSGGS